METLMHDSFVGSAEDLVARIDAVHKINKTLGYFQNVRRLSFTYVNYATPHLVANFSRYFEFCFLMSMNTFVLLMIMLCCFLPFHC